MGKVCRYLSFVSGSWNVGSDRFHHYREASSRSFERRPISRSGERSACFVRRYPFVLCQFRLTSEYYWWCESCYHAGLGIRKTSAFEANPSTVAGFNFCGSCKFDDEFGC